MVQLNNISSYVLEKTRRFETKPAFILKEAGDYRRPLSFKEFNDHVLKISFLLKSKFPHPGFKIALWGENRIEWAAMALAVWHSGGTLVPLMHISTDQEIKTIIARAKLDGLFISPKLSKEGDYGVKNTFSLDFKTTRNLQSQKGLVVRESLGDLLQQLKIFNLPKFDQTSTLADDIAVLIFTSGTTGKPKGVMLSHGNILSNITDTIDIVPCNNTDRLVSVLPLSHMFELLGGFTVVHAKGACLSFPDSLKPEDVIKELNLHKATALASVPLFFEILDRTINDKLKTLPLPVQKLMESLRSLVSKHPPLGKIIFRKIHQVFGGSIKYFMSGGAKIDPAIIARFKSLGIYMFQGYGLTETSPVISLTAFNQDKYGSVGKVVSSLKVKILKNNNEESGEILVKGPSVFKGYFEEPEATAKVMTDGWFNTGDVGRIDEDGYLFLTGRKKDMIVTPNGKNIYPEEIEYYLKTSPHFQEVSVLGMETGRGESVHAVIVTKLLESDVWKEIERLSVDLSDYKKVQSLTLTQKELPKTATRKVKKHLLKERILKGELGNKNGLVISGEKSRENALSNKTSFDENDPHQLWLKDRLSLILKREDIYLESSLRHDLTIDSLTFMEIISNLEQKWNITVLDQEFERINTVNDLVIISGRSQVQIKKAKAFDYKKNNLAIMNYLRIIFNVIFLKGIFKFYFNLKVINKNEVTKQNNFIMTPNHSSHLDLLSLFASIPLAKVNKTYAVAADDYFFNHWLKSWVVRLFFNAVPFKRKARIEESFNICEEILKDRGNLIIFPEGTRSPDGKMSDFKAGVGRLLSGKSQLAIPVYIKGAFEAFPKGARFPQRSPIIISFGAGKRFNEFNLEDKTSYLKIAAEIQSQVVSLKI